MKRVLGFLIFLAALFAFTNFSVAAEEINASSYVLIEADTLTVLKGKLENEKREPASTTKILTALVALENASLDSVFKVSAVAANVEGSGIGLEEGEEVILEDLLYMLLLKSGNDAAVTIAENISGSVEEFAALMNGRAKKIGCENSNFENPHGLHSDKHYTTAYDLALITAEALKNEKFSEMVSTSEKTLKYKNLTLKNSNKLLADAVFTGVKTGFTKAAGRCLVSSAAKDGVTLICVTMRDPDDWKDHTALMSEGFERVEKYEILKRGEVSVSSELLGGLKGVYTNAEAVYGISVDDEKLEYKTEARLYPVIFAPQNENSVGGYLEVTCGEKTVAKVPLYLREDVLCAEKVSDFELFLYNFGKILKILL